MSDQRYLVAARKYRPPRFDALVAQDHVTETLKNALRLDRLAHAYLFSGPRGVGKTTAARILAKAINCTTALAERPDGAEPCRQCPSCRDFEAGRSLDIFEIDAASNNKVDDIRELREAVRVPPQGSRKKVYIVDEVHMLSNAAFNALLKTLEEPPPHVLFIFATTEPHKVLPTILSRCQRFDFRRIPVPETVARLREICQAEAITADDESLILLARKGDGALRDALSAFDQAVSLCGTDLRYAELAQALGVVDVDLFFEVTRHVRGRDGAGMIRLVDRLVRSGHDLQEFLVGLAEHLRNLLVALTMEATDLIEATAAVRQRYAEASRHFTEPDLLRLLMLASEAEEAVKHSAQPRLKLEVVLLKMASLAHAADLRTALQKLERLEKLVQEGNLTTLASELKTGDAAPSAEPPADSPPATEPPRPAAPPEQPAPEPPSSAASALPDGQVSSSASPFETAEPPLPSDAPRDAGEDDVPGDGDVPSAPSAEPPRPPAAAPPGDSRPAPPSYPGLFGQPALRRKAREAVEPARPSSGASAQPPPPAAVAAPPALTVEQVQSVWPRFVQRVKTERIHLGTLLQHAAPLRARDDLLVLTVPDRFHERFLRSEQAFLVERLKEAAEVPVAQLGFEVGALPEGTADAPAPAPAFDPYAYLQKKRAENPVVRAIFEQFGGELVW